MHAIILAVALTPAAPPENVRAKAALALAAAVTQPRAPMKECVFKPLCECGCKDGKHCDCGVEKKDKDCPCSEQCVCGCNSGGSCSCQAVRLQASPRTVVVRPASIPFRVQYAAPRVVAAPYRGAPARSGGC